MSSDQVIVYRHIAEDFGGVASTTSNTVSAIGTRGCITCVGVYFPVDKDRCFVAHINAFIEPSNFDYLMRTPPRPRGLPRTCEGHEGEQVKGRILAMLKDSVRDANWSPDQVDTDKVIVVCPHPAAPYTGKYIIDALQEFLNTSNPIDPHSDCHGFIVEPHSHGVAWLKGADFCESRDVDTQSAANGSGTWKQKVDGKMRTIRAEAVAPWHIAGSTFWRVGIRRNVAAEVNEKRELVWEETDSV